MNKEEAYKAGVDAAAKNERPLHKEFERGCSDQIGIKTWSVILES